MRRSCVTCSPLVQVVDLLPSSGGAAGALRLHCWAGKCDFTTSESTKSRSMSTPTSTLRLALAPKARPQTLATAELKRSRSSRNVGPTCAAAAAAVAAAAGRQIAPGPPVRSRFVPELASVLKLRFPSRLSCLRLRVSGHVPSARCSLAAANQPRCQRSTPAAWLALRLTAALQSLQQEHLEQI